MKKKVSLLLAMVMVFAVTSLVSANEITERRAMLDYAREISPMEREMLLDRHIREFEDDAGKQEAFLAAVAQRESAGAIIDNRELSRMAREIKYAGIEAATPISVVSSGGSELQKSVGQASKSLDTPMLKMSQLSAAVYIDNPIFSLGYSNPVEITYMKSGFVWSEFEAVNGLATDKVVLAIVKLWNKKTLIMHDVAVVKKNILSETSEIITAGFNVPGDANNYEIIIELWDDNMNLLDKTAFPEPMPPHAAVTVANGNSYLNGYVSAMGDFTIAYNGNIETYVSNGYYVQVGIHASNVTPATPIIFSGDLTRLDFMWNDLTSFSGIGLTDLTFLNLGCNQLTSFDATELSALTYLDLYQNQLTMFSGTDLFNLESLFLEYNMITEFNTASLSNLVTLVLSSNQLTTFSVEGLHNLSFLTLSRNQLTTFNGADLSNLKLLDLYYNLNLSNVVIPALADVPNGNNGFRDLDLSYTALGNLSAPNSVWNDIIANLPVRNSISKGYLGVSNAALKIALNNALTTPINKYWNVN